MNKVQRKKDEYNAALYFKFALVKKFGVANPVISKKTLSRFNKAKSKCNEGRQKKDEYNTALYFKFCIGQENWGC